MPHSSPLRRSQLLMSPERGLLSSFLFEGRNNELSHLDALAAAQVEHERVREAALRVYELHELKEEHQRILDLERKEQERLKAEAAIVAEEIRLRELKAKTIPRPPPEPIPEPPRRTEQPTPNRDAPARAQDAKGAGLLPAATLQPAVRPPVTVAAQPNGLFSNNTKPVSSNPFGAPSQKQPESAVTPSLKPVTQALSAANTAARSAQTAPTTQTPKNPLHQRYIQIHQELKKLRQVMQAEAKVEGSPLKAQMGDLRRKIRNSIGRLAAGKGANTQPINIITAALKAALEGHVPSPQIEVARFVVSPGEPVEGVPNNDATLPSLFIYFLNVCAKAIINQFISECGTNPQAADPIGVFTAHIFSHKEFQWRGQSLIDILMAKLRIVCPALFGVRGNDKTERGRMALGWKKDGPSWISDQTHNDRMTGLGAGFASLSLRDFSKSTKANPYPPIHYWRALASIINTPANETSNTQYIVLRAMIMGHEQRILNFYGNAGIAALRLALVEFPKRAPKGAMAADTLLGMAEILRQNGLALE